VKIGNNTSVQDAAHIGVEGAAVVLGDDVVVCTCRCPSRCSRTGHSFALHSFVCCVRSLMLLLLPTTCAAPGARVVSATVESGARIGMGAHVLPGAVVGKNAFVDAGSGARGRGVDGQPRPQAAIADRGRARVPALLCCLHCQGASCVRARSLVCCV
jgi:carbonic anhydrase/acetyltransferase-like protein (isoleucine patch superfamily)